MDQAHAQPSVHSVGYQSMALSLRASLGLLVCNVLEFQPLLATPKACRFWRKSLGLWQEARPKMPQPVASALGREPLCCLRNAYPLKRSD